MDVVFLIIEERSHLQATKPRGIVGRHAVVMEQIPLSLVLTDTMMGGPAYHRFQDNTLVSEWSVRIIAYRIAEIMGVARRVTEVILALILVHPTCLEEAMWIIGWQYLALLVNDNHRLWHLGKLLHVIGHHCYP